MCDCVISCNYAAPHFQHVPSGMKLTARIWESGHPAYFHSGTMGQQPNLQVSAAVHRREKHRYVFGNWAPNHHWNIYWSKWENKLALNCLQKSFTEVSLFCHNKSRKASWSTWSVFVPLLLYNYLTLKSTKCILWSTVNAQCSSFKLKWNLRLKIEWEFLSTETILVQYFDQVMHLICWGCQLYKIKCNIRNSQICFSTSIDINYCK